MSRNGTITTIDSGPSGIAAHDRAYELITSGGERIQDLVRQSTLDIQQVLGEARETIAKSEAEIEVNEKVSVILEPGRTVLSVERNFRFAKDK